MQSEVNWDGGLLREVSARRDGLMCSQSAAGMNFFQCFFVYRMMMPDDLLHHSDSYLEATPAILYI